MQSDETLQPVIMTLKAHNSPVRIWQEPFEHNGDAYKRLCSLNGAEPRGDDLAAYTQDISYGPGRVQADFFRYMLPICLQAWKSSIFGERGNEYATFEDDLFASWLRRGSFHKLLNEEEILSVENYLAKTILELISKENKLHHSGGGSDNPVYRWFGAVSSFGVLFPRLAGIWQKWWQMSSDGHAVAALQYISCLMYEEDENPIFSAWTKDEGGGPPPLNCTFNNIGGTGWRQENISFLTEQLTLPYLEDRLRAATVRLMQITEYRKPCERLLGDWNAHCYLVEHRLAQLPSILANVDSVYRWPAG